MKLGTTGTSMITKALITAFQKVGIEVLAATSRSKERGEAMAAQFKIKKVYVDYDEMLKDPELDTVYVALPNALHFDYAERALLAGKNVIMEKPFVKSLEEAEELVKLARKEKLYLLEAITVRYRPTIPDLKAAIREIAPIRLSIFNFSKYSSKYDAYLRGENPNIFRKEMAGGALMDLNIYNLQLAYILYGMPKEVHYFGNMQTAVDTSGVAILDYHGQIVDCIAGKDVDSESFGQIMGEKGMINFKGATSIFDRFTLTDHHGQVKEYGPYLSDSYEDECRKIKDIIDNKHYEENLRMQEDTLAVMRILDALYQGKTL